MSLLVADSGILNFHGKIKGHGGQAGNLLSSVVLGVNVTDVRWRTFSNLPENKYRFCPLIQLGIML